ncbi:hypothetical protein N9N67_07130 [Bacteriovoracaceae bacterium]|nr:hypothetical protein [Bacteriovoracaceae bacterium]
MKSILILFFLTLNLAQAKQGSYLKCEYQTSVWEMGESEKKLINISQDQSVTVKGAHQTESSELQIPYDLNIAYFENFPSKKETKAKFKLVVKNMMEEEMDQLVFSVYSYAKEIKFDYRFNVESSIITFDCNIVD